MHFARAADTAARQSTIAEAYMATNQAETAFLQHRAGTLDQDVFEARIDQYMGFVADTPLLREVWSVASKSMIPEFATFIEERFSDA